ncbi:MAG: tRNA-dihydrouridine synthase [Halobacteriales archaeon]
MRLFEPRVAAASLSGRSDAAWARRVEPYVGAAFLGGVAVDGPTRRAASRMADRDREEFLPDDPVGFVDRQLDALAEADLRAGVNVRAASVDPLREVAAVCTAHDAILEINAHCRQDEMEAVGGGEALLADADRLARYVRVAADTGATVGVKVRTEVDGVDLPATSRAVVDAGADLVHVDAMDSEAVVAGVADAVGEDAWVVANNEVRDRDSTLEYLRHGADAVSVARPTDDPTVLSRVQRAVADWFLEGRA